MFFFVFLTAFLLPNVYLFFRIRSLLDSRRQRAIAVAMHVLVVLAFMVTEVLSHIVSPGRLRPLMIISYDSLPFLLYVFLIVLVFDFALGLNRFLKIVPQDTLRLPGARRTRLLLIICVPAAVVLGGSWRFSQITINHYQVQVPRKASPLGHLRIALASDFHLKELTDPDFMGQFVEKVNSTNADLLLIPGDILEGDRQDGQVDEFESGFRKIRTRYGTYVTLGNHEFYGRRTRTDFFEKSSMVVLRDTVLIIGNAFALIGRQDAHFDRRKPIAELMRAAPDSLPTIVLDQRPTEMYQVSATGADILVSGHTHDGQLFPINLITGQIYGLSWGYRLIGKTNVFVTSGVQLWGPPVRTAGDSEIMLIDVDLVSG